MVRSHPGEKPSDFTFCKIIQGEGAGWRWFPGLLEASLEAQFPGGWLPAVDVIDGKDKVTVKAELPGMKKEEIEISLQEGVLNLSGERKGGGDEKSGGVVRSERWFGRFQRSRTSRRLTPTASWPLKWPRRKRRNPNKSRWRSSNAGETNRAGWRGEIPSRPLKTKKSLFMNTIVKKNAEPAAVAQPVALSPRTAPIINAAIAPTARISSGRTTRRSWPMLMARSS